MLIFFFKLHQQKIPYPTYWGRDNLFFLFFQRGFLALDGREAPKTTKNMRIITLPQVPEIFGAGQHYVVAFIIFIAFVFSLTIWLAKSSEDVFLAINRAFTEFEKLYWKVRNFIKKRRKANSKK